MINDDHTPERPASYEDGQDIRDRSFQFACDVVGFCEQLESSKRIGQLMVPQLLSCSLSFARLDRHGDYSKQAAEHGEETRGEEGRAVRRQQAFQIPNSKFLIM